MHDLVQMIPLFALYNLNENCYNVLCCGGKQARTGAAKQHIREKSKELQIFLAFSVRLFYNQYDTITV